MGKNKIIIEFWGLQGSGKTTLCNNIKSQFEGRVEYKFCRVPDVIQMYHQEPLLWKLCHFPLMSWSRLLFFLLSIPNKKKNEKEQYISLFILTLAYYYFEHQNKYNILAVDHGLMQQLSSMLFNFKFQMKQKAINRWASFYNGLNVSYPFYCSISKDISLQRILFRNRKTGRIDKIMNDKDRAINLLEKEKELLDSITDSLRGVVVLDMQATPEVLSSEVISKLLI